MAILATVCRRQRRQVYPTWLDGWRLQEWYSWMILGVVDCYFLGYISIYTHVNIISTVHTFFDIGDVHV